MDRQNGDAPRGKPGLKEMLISVVMGLCFIAQVVLCFLYFNSLQINWLVYLGGVVMVLAVLISWRARVVFETKGGAPDDESWLNTRRVVITGIYGMVRHPMYLSFMLISLSLVLLSQNWLNALMGSVVIGILYYGMYLEEQNTIARFGDEYRSYMQQVPMMNIAVGLLRALQRRSRAL